MPVRNHNKGGSMKAWIRLLMAASAALATQAFGQGYPNKPVHVIISFTPGSFTDIAPLAMQPNVLVVNAGAPYKTVMDLVNAAKANPGAINWGHAGIGSGTHLNTEKFVAAANVKVTQVPFKGTPEVIQAMFSGSVDCYWVPISAGMSHIKSGKLRPLAVSTAKRNP